MRRIFTIGESLIDIIFRGDRPEAARPGGAMLNTAVSLGRLGLPVYLISEYGNDDPGNLIDKFVKENNINSKYISRYSEGNTALALAFLDENNNARYTFYKNYPKERLSIQMPLITEYDVFLFGSIYSITLEIRNKLFSLALEAFNNGALTIYDPNFRSSHLNKLNTLLPMLTGNMKLATIVRGSNEDFNNIFGATGPEEAWEEVGKLSGCMIYTTATAGVWVVTNTFSGRFPVKKITPVSTIGAGDSFNAGLITAFYRDKIFSSDINKLGSQEWEKIISTAVDFATETCLNYDNYIDLAFASKYRSASRFQI
ncbi:MAG TPA: PfkB family carbohydrate kinase [Bacteroidales bacterium]|nr:carbohydrate kinase [Bacteroidales bacterium]HOU97020.1 PfkB family carbohydrate kinase [Bacteroidales bacterium]HQG37406.1 PfkB family carbohydrate kinase [Bacteroidales bacterium]HQG52746.1 PfkB family carbohydrate kinase [Bacteroidales bacterium]HQJ20451.1 PfkB family carbohydrate kinase [Bacteroidales bacterium]